MSSFDESQHPRHGDGKFSHKPHLETSVTLNVDQEAAAMIHVERLIAAGRLSPAARGMDPREAIDQMAAAEALDYSEHSAELAAAGLHRRGRPADLLPGDEVILAHGPVEVTAVHDAGQGRVTLELDNGSSWTLPGDDDVEFDTGPNRCLGCGQEADYDGWDGHCGECADARDGSGND